MAGPIPSPDSLVILLFTFLAGVNDIVVSIIILFLRPLCHLLLASIELLFAIALFFIIAVVVIYLLVILISRLLFVVGVRPVTVARQKLLLVIILLLRVAVKLIALAFVTFLRITKFIGHWSFLPGLWPDSRDHHTATHSPPVLMEGSLLPHLLVLQKAAAFRRLVALLPTLQELLSLVEGA